MTDGRVIKSRASFETSSSLLVRMRNNDPDGWKRFVHLYSPLVYRWCRQCGLQADFAADVGQEVFRAVVGAISKYRHHQQGNTFRGWLRTITVNKVRDFVRDQPIGCDGIGGSDALNLLYERIDGAPISDDSRGDELVVLRQAIEMVLSSYDETTRRAFWRAAVDGWDPVDVAQELGLTVNSVYLAKSRIKHRLRQEFAGLIDSM